MTAKEYNECVKLFADPVYRYIRKSLSNDADAEDIMQHTFEKLWIKKETVAWETAKSYTYRIASNALIDLKRKVKRHRETELSPTDGGGFRSDRSFEIMDSLNLAFETLSKVQKSVVLLRDYEGFSYQEIAEMLELSESQVKVYIFRGRKKLKQYLNSLDKVI